MLKIEGAFINGNIEQRLYNVANICFVDTNSDALIMGLSNLPDNLPLIAVSNGSACTLASIEPSHVLIAMGLEIEPWLMQHAVGQHSIELDLVFGINTLFNSGS